MHEKTVAKTFRIFQVTVTPTPTTLYDLLSAADKLDYDSLNKAADEVAFALDGHVKNGAEEVLLSSSAAGAQETMSSNSLYLMPVYKWPKKLFLATATTATITAKVYFG